MRVRSEADRIREEPKGGKARGGARGGGRGAARGGRGGCTGQAATKEVDQGGEEEVVEGEGKAAEKIGKAGVVRCTRASGICCNNEPTSIEAFFNRRA